jgi:major intracellular serine protease
VPNPILPQLFPYEVQDVAPQQEIPWNVSLVNAPSFWQKTRGDGAIVAVVDTGIDAGHPEFEGRILHCQSFVKGSPNDDVGHGCHVAAIIAGKTCGIAPEAKIIACKVFGEGNGFQFQDAFRFLVQWNEEQGEENRIAAVNCSWGGPYDAMIHYFIRKLIDQGTAVVCSAGNAGDGDPTTEEMFNWPGFLFEPVTVGAVNKDATAAKYSSSPCSVFCFFVTCKAFFQFHYLRSQKDPLFMFYYIRFFRIFTRT